MAAKAGALGGSQRRSCSRQRIKSTKSSISAMRSAVATPRFSRSGSWVSGGVPVLLRKRSGAFYKAASRLPVPPLVPLAARADLPARGLDPRARASVHYHNGDFEVERPVRSVRYRRCRYDPDLDTVTTVETARSIVSCRPLPPSGSGAL